MFTDLRQRLVSTRPPCNLRDMKKIAREVTDQYNGKGSDLAKKGDPYSAYREVGSPACPGLANYNMYPTFSYR